AYFLRHLKDFLGVVFKIDELKPSLISSDGSGRPNKEDSCSSGLPVHSIPAKISYDGPARVETYFDSTRVQKEDGTETATFRGRPLNGVTSCLPEGYRLYVTENTSKGDKLQLTALKEAEQFTVWSLDANPNSAKVLKALTWLDVASEGSADVSFSRNAFTIRSFMNIMQIAKWVVRSTTSFLLLHTGICIGQAIALVGAAEATGYFARLYNSVTSLSCHFYECCQDQYIKIDLRGLKRELKQRVYGQHLVINTVVNALAAHFKVVDKKKPLVLSFHGWTGGGKNYVTSFIARHLYKKGLQSRYVHQFSGSLHFPEPQKSRQYTVQLQTWIRGNASICGRSLFIFDEVELMPAGVLDGIKTFMEYREDVDRVDFRDCVFIFL
ncbi:hypothetical protein M513_14024, partial [Trichuris suis]